MTTLSSSSPSPRLYQTEASPSRGKNGGRGRQDRRELAVRSIIRRRTGWGPFNSSRSPGGLANNSPPRVHAPRPPDQEELVTDSSDSPTTCAAPLLPRSPGRQTPAPVPSAAATGSFPFQSTSPLSDRSRGTRLQAHVVQDCWCKPAPKPASRHRRVERTFRTAWGTRSRPGLP